VNAHSANEWDLADGLRMSDPGLRAGMPRLRRTDAVVDDDRGPGLLRSTIHFASMSKLDDDNNQFTVADLVDNTVLALPNAIAIVA